MATDSFVVRIDRDISSAAFHYTYDRPALWDATNFVTDRGVGVAITIVGTIAVVLVALRREYGRKTAGAATPLPAASMGTWDCGYADPSSPRLQYTASSMGEMLARLFRWAIWLKEKPPRRLQTFPSRERYESEAAEPLLGGCLMPFSRRWATRFSRLRILQRGNVQIYLVYILVTLVVVIAWAMVGPRGSP